MLVGAGIGIGVEAVQQIRAPHDVPAPWTALASTPDPFAMTSVTFELAAGSNVSATDVAKFDNVATS